MSWSSIKLSDCCEIVSGSTPRRNIPEYWDGDIFWVTPKDLSDLEGKYIESTPDKITDAGYKSCSTTLLPVNSVLLSSRAPIGHVAINTVPMATNQGFKSFIPDPEVIDSDYLYYWLKANTAYLNSLGRGATFKEISKAIVSDIEIPLPPLAEQRRIAAILDKADDLRRKRRAALAKLDALLQATFLEMFGDPVVNPKGWEVRKLGEVGILERGKSRHRPRNAPELLGGKYPLIQTGDVANANGGYLQTYTQTYSELGLAQSRLWEAGVLCITIAANIANTAILTFDACFPDSVVGFLPSDAVTTEYVQYWLLFLREMIEQKADAVAQKNINLQVLRTLDIPTPPIQLQAKFSDAVNKIAGQRGNISCSAQQFDALFSALQQRAFRGEL